MKTLNSLKTPLNINYVQLNNEQAPRSQEIDEMEKIP
jgi:hypothetical protein